MAQKIDGVCSVKLHKQGLSSAIIADRKPSGHVCLHLVRLIAFLNVIATVEQNVVPD